MHFSPNTRSTSLFQTSKPGSALQPNSDASAVWHSPEHMVLVVYDGVSRSLRGGTAARLVVDTILEACETQTDWSDPLAAAREWTGLAHDTVVRRCHGEGLCTLVLAVVSETTVRDTYAGDSSCLSISPTGDAKVLTKPHRGSVLRMQNGAPVFHNGMPIFDHGLTRAIGQLEPLEADEFHCSLSPGDWIACFSDGIDERRLELFVRQQPVTTDTVEAFVAECASHSRDDATLILFRPLALAPGLRHELGRELHRYRDLDDEARNSLIERLDHPLAGELVAEMFEAYHTEEDDGRACRLARLLIRQGALDRPAVIALLDKAVLRRQAGTCAALKRTLALWPG